jgi:hypothetical protein
VISILMFGWMSYSYADDPSPGLMPGAAAVERGWTEVRAGAASEYLAALGGGLEGGVGVGVAASPAQGVVVSAFLAGGRQVGEGPGPMSGWILARANVLERADLRVAFTGGVAGVGGGGWDESVGLGLGLALDGGGRVRWDVSAPLLEAGIPAPQSGSAAAVTAVLSEVGVTIPAGARHRVRLGKLATGVGVLYRYEAEGWSVEASTATYLISTSAGVVVGRAL